MKPFHQLVRSLILLVMLTILVPQGHAKKWVVNVQNYSFSPFNLTHVKAGDTIQWVWVEGVHSTTSTTIPEGADAWDNPITNADPVFIYIPRVNGTYFYQCTQHAGTMSGTFVVSGASGLSAEAEIPNMTLFPNPFTEHINIQTNSTTSWVKSLTIFSVKGELIRFMNYGKGTSQGMIIVDLKDIAPGIYMIRITDNLNRSLVRRVIRN